MSKSGDPKAVDAYIAAQPAAARAKLTRVRSVLRNTLKGSVEDIGYQIPRVSLDGRMVIFFAGHRAHVALYPVTPFVVDALAGALDAHMHGAATARFALDDTLPVHLIARVAKARADEVASTAKRKAAAGAAASVKKKKKAAGAAASPKKKTAGGAAASPKKKTPAKKKPAKKKGAP